MALFLGIDTSNYTTSVAVFNSESNEIVQQKKLLPVPQSKVGLRQSDAVFAHIKQLGAAFELLFNEINHPIEAVCVSTTPRSVEGSYMPAFLVGEMVAKSISAIQKIPCYTCSHQEGHIVAGLYSSDKMELLSQSFYAFHISGGTTEGLLVKPSNGFFDVELIAKTLDLNAGQLIDRVGVMLSLDFPCGKAMDALSHKCDENIKVKTSFKELDCNISGAENQANKLKKEGKSDSYIALFVINYIQAVIEEMTSKILLKHGVKPLLYIGGVMSNSRISEYMSKKYGGSFAKPEFSTDNAAGVAIIGKIKHERKKEWKI